MKGTSERERGGFATPEQRGFPREDCECECHDLGDNCYSCFVAHANYDEWKRALKGGG